MMPPSAERMAAEYQEETTVFESTTTIVRRARRADGTTVILKSSSSEFPVASERGRLVRELEILRSLDVPGVCRAIELVEGERGPVLVLSDSGGRTLHQAIGGRGMELAAFFPVALGLAHILGAVHEAGVVHKDVNPSNIVLDVATGAPRLIDFGIASRLSREYAEARTTDLVGTLEYLAPEQTGRMNRAVDWRSDLYSLGATYYEMLTGRPPVARADAAEMIHTIIARPPAPPHRLRPSLPPALSAIVTKLLAKTMEERYQTAAGLARDLELVKEALATGRSLDDFEPGRTDHAVGFSLPQRLYGRDEALTELYHAFERAGAGSAEALMVTGPSGVGKSTLIHEIERPSALRRGYLVEGKFEQFHRSTRSGVARAVRDLLRRVLTESEERLGRWRERLAAAVGESGALLVDEIPELVLVLGPQPPVPTVASEENRVRINALWLRLVQAFADPAHPLVMFFDDLQWADVDSVELIERLVLDPDSRCLLLLGAYRDDEVDPSHPVSAMLEALRVADRPAGELRVGPVEREHVLALVSDTLHCEPEVARPLAGLIYDKSGGNPLFVRELLTSLYETGELRRTDQGLRWDIGAVESLTLTDNVAELMSQRLRRLGEQTQRVLQLAACIGGRFDVQTLAVVCELGVAKTLRTLWPALEAGLVVAVGDSQRLMPGLGDDEPDGAGAMVCRFAHDRVQQAAHDLVSGQQRQRVHLRIGRLLLEQLDPSDVELRVMEIVQHFDECIELVDDPAERARLLELYLAAGLRAKRVAAHEPARRWLARGRGLLRDDAWTRQYEQALPLHTEGAEVARLLQDFDEMEALSAVVRTHAKRPLDLLAVHETRILHMVAQNRPGEAVDVAREALRVLGVSLPARPSALAVGVALLATVRAVRRRGVENLATLPEMDDEIMLAAMRVMMRVGQAAFVASPNLFVILACRMVRLSLRHGNSSESSWGYMLLAFCVANVLGNRAQGWSIADFSLSLMDRTRARDLLAKNYASYYATIAQWNGPWRDALEPLQRGQRTATEIGDIEFGCTLAMIRSWLVIFVEPFESARRHQAECLAYTQRHGSDLQTVCITTLSRLVVDLRGEDPGPLEVLDDDEAIAEQEARRNDANLFLLGLRRGMIASLLGEPREAIEHFGRARKRDSAMLGTIVWSTTICYQSLAMIAVWPGLGAGQRLTLRINRRRLRTWARHSPINFEHQHLMVEAEWARVHGRDTAALQGLEKAAKVARTNGFGLDAARAIELAARHCLRLGLERAGWGHLRDAARAYRSWGVLAKADALDEELKSGPPAPMLAAATTASSAPSGTTSSSAIDMSTVFRATRAISEEIVLGKLVRELVQLLLQNAAGQRGVLVVERDGTLVVEAHASVEDDEEPLAVPLPLTDEVPISVGIVSYVVRTGESVVLHDAAVEGMFVDDPYVTRRRPRSILCAPLLNQQRMVAVVYIENNLSPRAFTDQRLEVVRILMSQAALSIHNARLYANLERTNRELEDYSHSLEQKVDERTQDLQLKNRELAETLQRLRDTQEHLVSQQKLASLGALTAGIAHELRNPLNFVINFAELSAELVGELGEALATARAAIDGDARAEVEDALSLLSSNVDKINEHGHRAEGIINNMLMHSRSSSSSEREVLPVNKLVADTVSLAAQGMRMMGRGASIDVVSSYDPAVGSVEVIPAEIRRVLVNIVNNAYDAMADKQAAQPGFAPRLTVSTVDRPDVVEIHVADNGPGVPEGMLDQVFQPFFTTKAPGKGTGLGLSLSHDIIVRGHGGALRVESTPGQGATFVITLPKHRAEAGGKGS